MPKYYLPLLVMPLGKETCTDYPQQSNSRLAVRAQL
jgi:hypothetical protein